MTIPNAKDMERARELFYGKSDKHNIPLTDLVDGEAINSIAQALSDQRERDAKKFLDLCAVNMHNITYEQIKEAIS